MYNEYLVELRVEQMDINSVSRDIILLNIKIVPFIKVQIFGIHCYYRE